MNFFEIMKLDVILLFIVIFQITKGIAINHWGVEFSLKTRNVELDIVGGQSSVRLLQF